MGSCLPCIKVEPQDILDGKRSEFDGPVKERSCTDIIWIIIMSMFTISLLGLMVHCISYGDIYRVLYGYDSCGNVCGMLNVKEEDPALSCKGTDMTQNKYLLIKDPGQITVNLRNVHKECVSNCSAYPEYKQFLRRCIPQTTANNVNSFFSKTGIKDFFQEVSEDVHMAWPQIFYLCLISLVLSLAVLFLLRFVTGFIVWFVLIATAAFSIGATIYLWIIWSSKKAESQASEISERVSTTYLVYAIIFTVVTVIILLIILVMRKRIKLVVKLFTEAGKAVNAMPLLLLQPIITFAALTVVMSLWLYFSLWIESSGYLHPGDPSFYYKKDTTMKVTRWYNLFGMFWMTQLCIGCQHMVIAGAVATWFFTRNKADLNWPVRESMTRLVRYHLGTVVFGALLIGLVQFARAILSVIHEKLKGADGDIARAIFKACQCCLYCFEKILAYLTRNAFIEVAIYGGNFCWSGQQALKILTNNALRVAAINSVGDFVLFLSKVFVVLFTLLIGSFMIEAIEGVHHMWVLLTLVGLFAYFVSHCFISVYEMVIDTIFVCFCEDCEINDGISKPYFMSVGLMEFVENTKKNLAVGDGTQISPQK